MQSQLIRIGAVTALAAALSVTAAPAQTLKSRATQKTTVDVQGFYDFDAGEAGTRASADLRLVKSSADNALYLEPLNGAGLGFLEFDRDLFQTCAANLDSLRASRLKVAAIPKGAQICVRTSSSAVSVFKLGEAKEGAIDIDDYWVWARPMTLPSAPTNNRVLYKTPRTTPTPTTAPSVLAEKAAGPALTFNIQMAVSNVMPEAAGYFARCVVYHPNASINGVATPNASSFADSPVAALDDASRRADAHTTTATVDFAPGFNLAAIQSYSCTLRLQKDALNSYPTFPEMPRTWPEGLAWRAHRGEVDPFSPPYIAAGVIADAADIIANKGGVIKTRELRFNGLAIPGGVAGEVPIPGTEEPTLPPSGVATVLTEDMQCPEPAAVLGDDQYRRGRNQAGWDTYYQKSGASGGEVYGGAERFYLSEAALENSGRTLECRYETIHAIRFDYKKAGKNTHENFARKGLGIFLSKDAPGACTPKNPAEWNENGVCIGEPADWDRPLCPSDDEFYDGGCMRSTDSRCAVTCPKAYQPE